MADFRSQMADEVLQRLRRKESFIILDVRELDEWMYGHIQQAKHIPLMELPARIHEIDRKQEIIVVCHSGGRSQQACQYLAHQGYNVINMLGGMSAWKGDTKVGA